MRRHRGEESSPTGRPAQGLTYNEILHDIRSTIIIGNDGILFVPELYDMPLVFNLAVNAEGTDFTVHTAGADYHPREE